MKIALVEPLIKHPIRLNMNGKVGDVGVRTTLAYLAGQIREDHPKVDINILPLRMDELKGESIDLEERLKDFDVVGITSTTTEFPHGYEIAKTAKQLGKTVVFGGIFPTGNTNYVLGSKFVDAVVLGEGEKTFSELIASIQTKGKLDPTDLRTIKGLAFKDKGEIIKTGKRELDGDLDALNPAYDLLPMKDYAELTQPGYIYGARGCYNKCNFCTLNRLWRFTYRPRSVESVVNELKHMKDLGFDYISFNDESVLLDREHAKALFTAIKQENLGMKYRVKCKINEVDDEILEVMRDANVYMLHFGLETPSQEHIDKIGKGFSAADVYPIIEKSLSMGFVLNPSYILGLAGETEQTLKNTSDFILDVGKKEGVYSYVSLLAIHPGTPLWSRAKKEGIRIISNDLNEYPHWRLVTVPDSLGDPYKAMHILSETQYNIIQTLGNKEPPLDIKGVLEANPNLEHLTGLRQIE